MKIDTGFWARQSALYFTAAKKVSTTANLSLHPDGAEAELEPWSTYDYFAQMWSQELKNIAASLQQHSDACLAVAGAVDKQLAAAARTISADPLS